MNFLANLVRVFPSLKTRPLHLTGESYAGTYIVRPMLRVGMRLMLTIYITAIHYQSIFRDGGPAGQLIKDRHRRWLDWKRLRVRAVTHGKTVGRREQSQIIDGSYLAHSHRDLPTADWLRHASVRIFQAAVSLSMVEA